MGLDQASILHNLSTQAKLLNFSKDIGLIVSDEEVAQKLQEIRIFQKDGDISTKKFITDTLEPKDLKPMFLKRHSEKNLSFKRHLRLLTVEGLPLEEEAISAAMNVSDKIAYKILTSDQVDFVADEDKNKSTVGNAKRKLSY